MTIRCVIFFFVQLQPPQYPHHTAPKIQCKMFHFCTPYESNAAKKPPTHTLCPKDKRQPRDHPVATTGSGPRVPRGTQYRILLHATEQSPGRTTTRHSCHQACRMHLRLQHYAAPSLKDERVGTLS
ncbi:hypothetical protein DQ04_03881100 [Trypanosoma grayi]|uniref:hypothetical protein n=1 Tax=Trypanosoma grayi TaxID=71804 RepID=UPI0004F4A5FF|nr:hypothetical protein DQ04_03881100 [Trypanosoma grayi]KEG10325.1 hypothetical protein DQ04_03881100 [Trypanosoma grayi]